MTGTLKHAVLIGVWLVTAAAATAADGWLTNFDEARKVAKEKGLPILADFSGSDWCGWCMKLDREVFSQPEFTGYAKDNLVLLLVDFPRRKEIPAEVKQQNAKLEETYRVRGYPTVLLLDAEGKVLSTTGYREGGAAAYVEHLKELRAKAAK